jgi:hypothetical protein
MRLHPTTPRRKFNAFNENGLPGRDRCPKCGLLLEEMVFGNVRIDKCFGCEGIWLDKGELETLQTKQPGFIRRMLNAFR